jgi:hypothetical protein
VENQFTVPDVQPLLRPIQESARIAEKTSSSALSAGLLIGYELIRYAHNISYRSINYDEKEPFLCNACGFCKYARLESFVLARQLPAVHQLETDADRTQVEFIKIRTRYITFAFADDK